MAFPETIRFQINKLVGEYCDKRVPSRIRAAIKVVNEVRDQRSDDLRN